MLLWPSHTGSVSLFAVLLFSTVLARSTDPADDVSPPTHIFADDPSDSCDVSAFTRANTSLVCSHIRENCSTVTFSLASKYYCSSSSFTRTVLLVLAAGELIFYFLTFALLTQHFLYPNLSLLAYILNISPKVAGLTLLALGNATPDVFSTYSAMSHNSASLALGELVGAANFVVCVVIGGMGILRPFEVDRHRFGWDLGMFAGLVGLACFFISDGKLRNWECSIMVCGYLAYVGYQIKYSDDYDEEVVIQQSMEEGMLVPRRSHDSVSVRSLNEDQMHGLQPVGLLDAQRIWSDKNSDEGEYSPLLSRPDLPRAFKSTEHIRYATERHRSLTKSASTDQVSLLEEMRPPTIVIDSIIEERDESLEQAETTTTEETVQPKDGPWWKLLFSPLTDDEPKTLLTLITSPFIFSLNVLNPVFPKHLYQYQVDHAHEVTFKKTLFYMQLIILPPFFLWTFSNSTHFIFVVPLTVTFIIVASFTHHGILIPVVGFLTSILLIILTSSHLITLLKNLGVVLLIPESLLGLTILAIGNSTGDLVSNLTLAGLDMGVVGLNACFGAPLLYILFGIGINGLVINLLNGKSKIKLEMDDNFKISATGLTFMLIFYAVIVPMKGWRIDRAIGIVGVLWWCAVTALNVHISM